MVIIVIILTLLSIYIVGSASDDDRDGRDNVFEDQASPKFRSDTEASPPASPTYLVTLQSERTLSKVHNNYY